MPDDLGALKERGMSWKLQWEPFLFEQVLLSKNSRPRPGCRQKSLLVRGGGHNLILICLVRASIMFADVSQCGNNVNQENVKF